MKATINTVNVIEMSEGNIVGMASYPDTPEGNKNAEQRFRDVANENTGYPLGAIEEAIENGILEDHTYSVLIFHSTV